MTKKSFQLSSKEVSWSFKEPKKKYSIKWYSMMALFFGALMIVSYLFMKSWSSLILFFVTFLALIFYTKKPRETVKFIISNDSIIIDKNKYLMTDYKSFYIKENKNFYSIYLIPIKKMRTELVLQFKEETGERLVDLLNQHLLMNKYTETFVDKIINFINL